MGKEFFTRKRISALLLILVMLFELFSPYSVLRNKAYAAETPDPSKPYFELALESVDFNPPEDSRKWSDATSYYFYDFDSDTDTFETYSGTKAVLIDVKIKNGTTVNGLNAGNIKLSYDTTKLIPATEVNVGTKKNPIYELQQADEINDMVVNEDGIYWPVVTNGTYLDASSGIVRIDGGTTGTMEDETLIATYLFKLADGVSFSDITKDLFKVVNEDDIMLAFDGGDYVNGKDYLFFSGFPAGAKQISNVELKTVPTKTQYYVGETLDFTDGELTVKYDDGTEETISISDAISSGKLTIDSSVATNSKKVTLTYDSETVDFEYYVLDSINVSKSLNKTSYEHGDTIEFTGGELTANYKNNAGTNSTKIINIENELTVGTLIVDKTTADVDNNVINFNYFGKTATINLTVTDPIISISITKQPTTLTYNDGDTINLVGGEITPHTKSGKALPAVATDNELVSISETKASIAKATTKWEIPGKDGLQAGNQILTLTYEGKTADLTIVVNDTISEVSITKQPTAKNKYGALASELDYTGLVATVTTTGGGSFTIGADSLTMDTTSYNANSLVKQTLPAKYGTISSKNNVEITLINYITSINVNFTKTEFDYGTPLATVLANGTYIENYADGTTSANKTITSGMVTGYNASPAYTLLTSGKYDETLTIKLSTSSNSFDKLPAQAIQIITINDVVSGIEIDTKPNKIFYNYGESFLVNGGQIKVKYISGASQIVSMGASTVTLREVDGSTINMSPDASEFTSGKTTKTIKVSYVVDEKTFNTTFDITIKDVVDSIAITTNPKSVYEHGDVLDTSIGSLTVTYKSENSEIVSLDEASVTETDGSIVNMEPTASEYTDNKLTKTLKVEYAGLTTNYNITLKNTVASITVTAPTKVMYNLNDSTDLTGGKITITRKAGDTKDLALTDSKVTVTNFDTSVAGTAKTANVKYTEDGKDYTGTFIYDVVNSITDIEIVAPSKTEYKHGESLEANGTITVKYADGTTSTRTMTESMITEDDGSAVNMTPSSYDNSTNKLTKTLKITYTEDGITKTINYTITIINTVKDVKLYGTPKTNYNVNEAMQAGLSILVTREAGLPETIEVTPDMISNFDTTTEGTRTAVITYTENGVTKTVNYEYTVTDVVTSISIDTAVKEAQKYNEELDLTGAKIKVISGKGTKVINIEQSMITGYDKTTLGEQTVTVEYGGKQTTFKVNVKDYVTKIVVSPETITGKYGDTLANIINNNNIMYIVNYAKAGDKTAVAVAESMVTGYNQNALTAQNLTVTYTDLDALSYTNGQDFTATLTVTLQDEISNIVVTAPTADQTYNYGEALDLTGATITVNYVSGATPKTVTPTVNMVVEKGTTNAVNMSPLASEFTNNKLEKQITLKYTEDGKEGSIDYLVTIINTVKEVTLYGTPKTNYNVNEAMQAGLSILVTREAGLPETIEVTPDMISNFDTTTEGTRTAVITYTENGVTKTVNYEYTVTDVVTSISIDTAVKEAQKYNEELDLTGAKIKVISGKGTKVINIEQSMITGYDKTTLGEQTVTVEYGGKQTTFKVNVKDYVTKIVVSPETITGKYGDTLANIINNNNIMYIVNYAKAGDKTAVAVAESMVTGYNQNALTAQNLTVTYTDLDALSYTNGQDFTATLTVTLQDEISNIVVTAPTADQTYNYGEALDLTGATITVNYVSGATPKTVTPTVNMVVEKGTTNAVNMSPLASEFTNNKLEKQVTLKYTEDGKEGSIDYFVTIINDVKDVSMNVTPKTSYNVGESLDLTNGKITVKRATGTDEVISITDPRVTVTGFDSSAENTNLTITVTFTENGITKQTSYEVSVTDTVTKIELVTSPKTLYKYNEELDLTGAKVKVTKGSGEETVQITESMITGYDKTTLGEQTVTVEYGGKQTTFKVNVKDYVTKIVVSPETITGKYGDTLANIINNNNIMYIVNYAKAGDKTAVAVAESMVTGYNQNALTAQNLTVTYTDLDALSYTNGQDFTATLTVTLQDEISNIVVTAPTADQTYNYGEALDLTGATITVNYVSGATPKTVTPTVNMVVEKGTTNAVNMSPLASEFTNNKLEKQVTLKYTEDGKEGSIDYFVTIINDVKEISMNEKPKTSYKIGESLDLTNGKITVKRATGTDEVINLTDPRVTVTGFDSSAENTNLTITVTFTENGITKQTSYKVSVVDSILSMEIETLPKQNYLYNEPLDVSAGTIKVTRNSGVEVINMTESMVKEMDNTLFNSKTLGTRNLKVTYGGITKTYEITVSDYVTGIIITPPRKTNYEYNEALDLTRGTVQKVMASGTIVAPVSLTQSMVSGYDATRIGAQTITVNYEGKQGNFGVIVSDNIQTIEMKTTPKTSYKYGDTLDVTNGTIEVTRSSGAKEIIAITKNMVTGFNSETLGTQELIVNYNGKQTTYEIEVKDYVKGIEITKPTKLVYNVGETIDLTNGKVKEIMASGLATSPVAMTDSQVTITGFDTTTVGAKTITVKYKGFTKTFSITVVDPTSSMVIKTLPNKLDYKYGEELDLTGGTIQVTKTSGNTEILNITKQMVSGYNPKKLGSQVITVTYDGKTAEFSVNVEDYAKQLNIKKPTKLEYEYGEELELDGGEVSVVMASGKVSDKTALTASMVEGYNKKKEGKQTLNVTYKGLSGKFDVNVVDLVKAISMDKQPNKVKYDYGQELDVTGATIKVIKSSGIYKIPVTKDMISGYSATTPGTQMITVTYKNEITNFIVIVGEKPAEPVTPVEPEEPTTPDKPQEPSTPSTPSRPTKPTTPTKPENPDSNVQEPENNEIIDVPSKPEEPTTPAVPEEKPTATLGDKDEKTNEDIIKTKMIAGEVGLTGLFILLLLVLFKQNTEIYVQEDGEFVLGGKEKLTKKHKEIDIDQYLDGNTYPNEVKVILNKKIAKKLDKQKIKIKHRGKTTEHVIEFNNEEFEIKLE